MCDKIYPLDGVTDTDIIKMINETSAKVENIEIQQCYKEERSFLYGVDLIRRTALAIRDRLVGD